MMCTCGIFPRRYAKSNPAVLEEFVAYQMCTCKEEGVSPHQ